VPKLAPFFLSWIVSPTAIPVAAMDVAGNLATVDQTLVIDTVATAKPVIGFATGEDMYVNATETGVNFEISSTGMAVGDTVLNRCIWMKTTAIADSIGIELSKPRTVGQMTNRANAAFAEDSYLVIIG
jgi:hypothetical protein